MAAALLLNGGWAVSQGTVDDYKRAYALREQYSARKVYYADVQPRWIAGTHEFWYVRHTPEGNRYVVVDAGRRTRKDLFQHEKLAAALSRLSGKEVTPATLYLKDLRLMPGWILYGLYSTIIVGPTLPVRIG